MGIGLIIVMVIITIVTTTLIKRGKKQEAQDYDKDWADTDKWDDDKYWPNEN